jgi:hypothetical protein
MMLMVAAVDASICSNKDRDLNSYLSYKGPNGHDLFGKVRGWTGAHSICGHSYILLTLHHVMIPLRHRYLKNISWYDSFKSHRSF